jgi:hypothetical protein
MTDAKPKKARRRKHPLYARNVLDFRPGIDHVVRDGNEAHLVDRQGIYAPVKVDGDIIDDAMKARIAGYDEETATKMFAVTQQSPFLSPEGRRERLSAILATGKVRLTFTVE